MLLSKKAEKIGINSVLSNRARLQWCDLTLLSVQEYRIMIRTRVRIAMPGRITEVVLGCPGHYIDPKAARFVSKQWSLQRCFLSDAWSISIQLNFESSVFYPHGAIH